MASSVIHMAVANEINKVIKKDYDIIPVTTELSDTVSKDLKKKGMKYVGSVILYSYLQAIGIVNDHDKDCFCRE